MQLTSGIHHFSIKIWSNGCNLLMNNVIASIILIDLLIAEECVISLIPLTNIDFRSSPIAFNSQRNLHIRWSQNDIVVCSIHVKMPCFSHGQICYMFKKVDNYILVHLLCIALGCSEKHNCSKRIEFNEFKLARHHAFVISLNK